VLRWNRQAVRREAKRKAKRKARGRQIVELFENQAVLGS
jgi:hypothetical protein